ncbi:hypothetical protein ANK1_3009 [plant metagenome]|uniref:Uncharacterized protein n=1 Tax=plant metagenome TaxID=1297885 RepID=A0A484SA33_9ZZZZ
MFSAVSHACPLAEKAVSCARRPSPAYTSSTSRSGGGRRPCARSGHSIKTSASWRTMSRNPASNHSRGSLNL